MANGEAVKTRRWGDSLAARELGLRTQIWVGQRMRPALNFSWTMIYANAMIHMQSPLDLEIMLVKR